VARKPAFELALAEALNNAVVHGNRMDRQKLVHVLPLRDGEWIFVAVKDQDKDFRS